MPQGIQWPTYGLPPGYTPPQLTNPQDNNTTAANTDPQNQAQQLDPGHVLVRDVTDIKTPMESIFEELCKVRAIEKKGDNRNGAMCAIHPDAEHSIEKCEKFKEVLQSLIDSQLVQITCERDEMGVNVVQESENAQAQVFPKVPTPLTLHGTHNTQAPTCHGPRPITIQVPSPFPYKNSKAVPWKYDVQVRVGDVQGNRVDPSIGHGALAVTNISGIGGMTRSGRIYTPKELQEVKEKENKDKFGLGYKATPADRKRVAEEKKEKRLARLENREPVTRGIPICDIRQSFRSVGFMFDNQVAVIEEEDTPARVHDAGSLVYPCAPDAELNNWNIIDFPVILSSVSK
ncbi:hypothetical protein SESBI_47884 [Sesbania bispinosa]|nr:hypothetical protein SESBI_47884 [Sesbania bispinosa]